MIYPNAAIMAFANRTGETGAGPSFTHAFTPLTGPSCLPCTVREPSESLRQSLRAQGIDDAKVIETAARPLRGRGAQVRAGSRVRVRFIGEAAPQDAADGWYVIVEAKDDRNARAPGTIDFVRMTARPVRDGATIGNP